MNTIGTQSPVDIISFIDEHNSINWNAGPEELVQRSMEMKMGQLSNNNVLAIDTGKFTGRSPKDRFIVKDEITKNDIDWGVINQPINEINYQKIKDDLINCGFFKQSDIIGNNVKKISNAYPVLEKGFENKVKPIFSYLATFKNLQLTGRNGLFEYSHIHDHMKNGRKIISNEYS